MDPKIMEDIKNEIIATKGKIVAGRQVKRIAAILINVVNHS